MPVSLSFKMQQTCLNKYDRMDVYTIASKLSIKDKDKDTLFQVNITHSLKKPCKYNDDMYTVNIKLYKVEH